MAPDDVMDVRPSLGSTIRVDSVVEERAYLDAYPSDRGPWEIVAQTLSTQGGRAVDRLEVQSRGINVPTRRQVVFEVASFVGTPGLVLGDGFTTEYLDRLMRAAGNFARENAVLHPGSLPRFPVPSRRFPGRIDVPLAVLAVDDGRRGLYAPPLVVTLDFRSSEPYGVGDFPGFDPREWPPARLGDWPPLGIEGIDQVRLQGMVARLSGCLTRLLDVWHGGADFSQRPAEGEEVLALLERLDPPGMLGVYKELNPGYWDWLNVSR